MPRLSNINTKIIFSKSEIYILIENNVSLGNSPPKRAKRKEATESTRTRRKGNKQDTRLKQQQLKLGKKNTRENKTKAILGSWVSSSWWILFMHIPTWRVADNALWGSIYLLTELRLNLYDCDHFRTTICIWPSRIKQATASQRNRN